MRPILVHYLLVHRFVNINRLRLIYLRQAQIIREGLLPLVVEYDPIFLQKLFQLIYEILLKLRQQLLSEGLLLNKVVKLLVHIGRYSHQLLMLNWGFIPAGESERLSGVKPRFLHEFAVEHVFKVDFMPFVIALLDR